MKPPSFSPSTFQAAAVDHCLRYDHTLLIAAKGFGKTRVGLNVAYESGGRVMILAPNKVCAGWVREGEKVGLPVTWVKGTPAARQALIAQGGIMVMGVDLIKWLGEEYKKPPFSGLILDETTRYSKPMSVGVRVLRRMNKHLDWVLGMTASPVMEDPLALYGQALVIDGGKTLGTSLDRYKANYFYPADYHGYKWNLRPGGAEALAQAVAKLVYVADDGDYQDSLPPLTEEIVEVPGSPALWQHYQEMCEEELIEVDGHEIEAVNEAVLSGKLEQVVQGAVYNEMGDAIPIHSCKMDALESLVYGDQLDGEPVIIVYQYKYELIELRQRFPGGLDLRDEGALEMFNGGSCDILFMHPRSGSYGINAQERCCEMIMLKPIWSADGHDQVIGRIWRQGQKRPCRRWTIVVPGTVDDIILDRVLGKAETGQSVLAHIKTMAQK
jgi:hypothetical protein